MSEKLHSTLVENGTYTKSYEEFVSQFSTADKQNSLHEALNNSGDYTKSQKEFKSQFFSTTQEDFPAEPEEVKEDPSQEDVTVEGDDGASTGAVSSTESQETETGPITIEPVSADITRGEEHEAEGLLADQYGRYGFKFTGSGATDNIIITGPPTEEFPEGEKSPAFSIDNWLDKNDVAAASEMTEWMQARAKTDQGSNLLANMSDVEVTEEQTAQNAIDDENILENYHYNVNANKAEEEDNERSQKEELQDYEDNPLRLNELETDKGTTGLEDRGKIKTEKADSHIKDLTTKAKNSIAIQEVMNEEGLSFDEVRENHMDKVEAKVSAMGDGIKTLKDLGNLSLEELAEAEQNPENYEIDDPRVREKVLEYLKEESHARSLSANVAEMVEGFEGGLFLSSGSQKVLEKAAEVELERLAAKDKGFVGKFTMVSDKVTNIDSKLSTFKTRNDKRLAEISKLRNKKYTTQEGVDKANARMAVLREQALADQGSYKALLTQRKQLVSSATLMQKEQGELQSKQEDLDVYFKAIGRNYQAGTVLGVTFANAAIDIGANIEEFAYALNPYVAMYDYMDKEDVSPLVKSLITGVSMINPVSGVLSAQAMLGTSGDGVDEKGNPTGSYRDQMVSGLYNFQEEMRNSIAEPIPMDEINSLGDLGMWAGTTLAQQAPLLALMYATGGTAIGTIGGRSFTAAEGLIFSSSAGGKFRGMKREMDLYDKTMGKDGRPYTWGQLYSTALLTGAAETLSEQVTLGQMKNMKGAMGGNKAARLGFDNWMKKEIWTPDNLKYLGKDFLEEGGSEALATISENLIDMHIAGNDVNIWDGVKESFASGVLISGTMKAPTLYRAMTAPFRSMDTNQKVGENAARINKLEKMAQDPDVLPENKAAYEAEIADLVIENNNLIGTDVKRVDDMTDAEKASLIKIEKENHFYRQRAERIAADGSLTEAQKADELRRLREKVDNNKAKKREIIQNYSPEDVKKNYEQRMDWLRGQAALVKEEGGKPINIIETDTDGMMEYQTSQEADEITYNQGLTAAMNEVVKDPDSTPDEIAEAQEYLKAAKQQGKGIKNMLNIFKGNASNYGAMLPKFDADGNVVAYDLLVNKETSITDGMFNTAAHEFVHAALYNTLKQDPAAQDNFGNAFTDILQNDANASYTDKGMEIFNRRIAQYSQAEGRGEEIAAISSELMLDGEMELTEQGLNKVKGIWRRFAQNRLGYDIKFDTPQDVKNFMIDYHKSVRDNKPSKAIAKMTVKGAKGKLVEGARTRQEIADQTAFSKAVDLNMKSNPDLRSDIDGFVKNEDGSPKFKDHAEFQNSNDYTDAYMKIVDSRLLDGLIHHGMLAKGLDSAALKDFTRKVKDKIAERYATNYNLDKNDSLFGWLTGVSGGAGKSIIYRAKGDVMAEYVKEGIAEQTSLDKQVGEAGTLADILEADRSTEMEAFENEDLSLGRKDAYVNGPVPVLDQLELTDTKNEVDSRVDKIQKGKDKVNLKGLTYKGVKNLLVDAAKVDKNGKMKKPTKASDVKPTGALYGVLEAVAKQIGVDPKRIIANQDLNAKQRKAVQQFLYTKIVNEDGSYSDMFVKDVLPEGETRSGEATGIANTKLGLLYDKGGRASFAEGATAAGKFTQTKRTDVTMEEVLGVFGINPDGSLQTGTASDGALRQAVLSIAQLAGNQSLRENALKNGTHSEAVIAQLGDGKAEFAWSRRDVRPQPTTQDIISNSWGDLINQVASGTLTNQEVTDAVENTYGDTVNKSTKNKITKQILEDVNKFININKNLKQGFETITGKNKAEFLIEQFEGRQVEQGLRKAFGTLLPKGTSIGNLAKDATSVTKQRAHLVSEAKNIIDQFGPVKGLEMIISQLGPVYSDMSKIGDGSLTVAYPGGPVIINKDFVGPSQNRNQVTTSMADFIALINKAGIEVQKIDKKVDKDMKGFTYKAVIDGKSVALNTTLIPEDSEAFIKNKDFDARKQQAQDARDITQVMLDNAWKKVNDSNNSFDISDFALLTMSMGTSMKSPIRRAANAEYIQDGIEGVIERGRAAGLPMKDIVRFEHMKSKEAVASEIIASYIDSGKLNPKVWDGYQVQVISVTADNLMNKVGYKTKSTLDGSTRLFNEATLNEVISNPSNYDMADFAPIRSMDPSKQGTEAETIGERWMETVEAFKNNVSLDGLQTQQLGRAANKANAYSWSKNPKGISVLDFDDTLATTKSGVRAKVPNPDGTPKPKRKVIFLAGGAGSGKGNVISKLNLEKQGFKIVNSDISLEWLKKNNGLPENMNDFTKEQRSTLGKLQHQARGIAKRKMTKYQGNGNGVVVDGTGGSIKSTQGLVSQFEADGYDVSMMFVETSLPVALERNAARKERSLLDKIVTKNHEAVQGNKDGFKQMFGDRFMEVNTDNLSQKDAMPTKLTEQMNDFVSGYENRRLDAEQFASEGADILDQGGTFDFSEFNKVVEGQTAPLFEKAMKLQGKFGTKDMFVLTARPAESAGAIHTFLKANGLDIPLENITGLANSTSEAKALWMADKVADGYNDFYFADDALQNVQAVQNMLDQFDVKSKVQQAKLQFSKNIKVEFNNILEETTGVLSQKQFSNAQAKLRGRKTKYKSIIPASAQDFQGLLYNFLSKGKKGEQQMAFLKKALIDPFARGIDSLNSARQRTANDYKNLLKNHPDVKKMLKQQIEGLDYTYDQAIRTYLWTKAGFEIPGLSQRDANALNSIVNNDAQLQAFAETVGVMSGKETGLSQPNDYWLAESLTSDLLSDGAVGDARAEHLAEWQENVDQMFDKEGLNKIEATYGSKFREALEDMLYRMKTGRNRPTGSGRLMNGYMNWVNNSVGAIMFFNMRSAILQTISATNYINWGFNNPAKAATAFANQPQYWKDFSMIFNSPYLKQRRAGNQRGINEAELSEAVAGSNNKAKSAIAWLLKKGFLPTQIADSFAIASGGATFFRNKVKALVKEGMTQEQAEKQAFLEFQEVTEVSQQSARPDMISQQQASPLGRLILAFQNTPMQYARIMNKATRDLVNGRGDTKTHMSKIAYYGVVQGIIFGSLQSALFAALGEEEEEEYDKKKERIINGMIDSVLSGIGYGGKAISTAKNTIMEYAEQKDKGWNADHTYTLLSLLGFSPPIGSKLRKIYSAIQTEQFNEGVSEKRGLTLDNPSWSKWGNVIEGVTNIPLGRLAQKMLNIDNALDDNNKWWERAALLLGWNTWDLGIKDKDIEAVKDEIKEEKKVENKKKQKIKKQEKKKQKEEENKAVIEDNKKKSKKDGVCSAVSKSGKRCKTKVVEGKLFCTVHESTTKRSDGKEVQCRKRKPNNERCKMKTTNKSGYCYYHD